ncbi:hypothetical protein SAMN05421774_10647 [Gemmobacter megaterium]|uniref:Protease inhibitor Inh n=1 Tax=Gemmobacter megaterium TaxID=1086013 RepID=A0A1N7PQL7_9RHOB|nr:hypothetical protein [Gemmobacter megaterium]GGE20649.1 hypothetical protein GCM10011345_28060 [Gemmobacter megaterium]SIT12842.1 hypothetical protein SAMN05421774_10647 [Gemmobacter megaterium]
MTTAVLTARLPPTRHSRSLDPGDIMRLKALALLALLPATLAQAETGVWSLIAESGGCDVSFLPEAVDDGIFFVDRGDAECGADIGRITGYALNEEGAVVVLYSTLDGVDLVGNVTRQADGVFTGRLRGGGVLRLEHKSGPIGIADPMTGLMTGETAEPLDLEDEAAADAPLAGAAPQGDCLSYAGREGTCAEQSDLGPPEGGQLQVLTRMNLRDQGTTSGSAVIGRAEAGACLAITFCSEDEQGRLWCGVQSDTAQGYLLKQDSKTVYALNTCR